VSIAVNHLQKAVVATPDFYSGYATCRSSNPAGFKYYGEYNFNLSEYVVILDKPLGLTLAPDPATGRVSRPP
jgi:hypothetical protein